MAAIEQFNALDYFEMLAHENRLCKEQGFKPVVISGMAGMESALQEFRKTANFVMIDDTTSQNTYSRGVGFFDKNVYTVAIAAHYKWGDESDRKAKLNLCRRIFRQFHSRLIRDKEAMAYNDALEYLNVYSVMSREWEKDYLNGVCGLYFMIENDEPVDLEYNEDDWEQ